jgi:hypothetical protein
LAPTFSWRSSRDPDQGGELEYVLHLRDSTTPIAQWSLSAGSDTVLALPFPLDPARTYSWEVTAEDVQGNRRTSRESFSFHTPGLSSVEKPGSAAAPVIQVEIGPNPFTDQVQFRVRTLGDGLSSRNLHWSVYDPAGRRLASSQGPVPRGEFIGSWNGIDSTGRKAPAGVYYLELHLGNESARRTLVRLPGAEHP